MAKNGLGVERGKGYSGKASMNWHLSQDLQNEMEPEAESYGGWAFYQRGGKQVQRYCGMNLWGVEGIRRQVSGGKGNKNKDELMGLHQDKKHLHSKGNNEQT